MKNLGMIRLAIRGFAGKTPVFEDHVEVTLADLENVVPKLAEQHAGKLTNHELHMIEIEFLDESDPNERFFRLGTDPSGMIVPIAIQLRDSAGEQMERILRRKQHERRSRD